MHTMILILIKRASGDLILLYSLRNDIELTFEYKLILMHSFSILRVIYYHISYIFTESEILIYFIHNNERYTN